MDWWNFFGKKTQSAVKLFAKRCTQMEENIEKVGEELNAQAAVVNALDLVIVMDCTGSMYSWIVEAKSSIMKIIDSVVQDHTKASVRVRFVAYRDFCDGSDRLQVQPLSHNIEAVEQFISNLGAFGGGDEPEDIPGGLDAAMKMKFRTEPAKRLVLVADAPCHGSQYSNLSNHTTTTAQIVASPCIRQQMRTLKARGIDFTFIEIVPKKSAKMLAILQAEYEAEEASNGFDREFYKVLLSQSGDIVHFGREVASSASSSLSMSKARRVLVSSKKVTSSKKMASSEKASGGVSSLNHYGTTGATTVLPGIGEADESDEESDDDDDEDNHGYFLAAPPRKPLDWFELDDVPAIPAVRHSYHWELPLTG